MEEISISTTEKNEILDITPQVGKIVANSAVKEGICLVYAPHATAAVMIMEADGAVEQDVLNSLSSLVPKSAGYEHEHGTESSFSGGAFVSRSEQKGPGHGASHVKSALFGTSQAIPVSQGKLQLGRWQSIVFCELDGPRADRKVFVQVVGK